MKIQILVLLFFLISSCNNANKELDPVSQLKIEEANTNAKNNFRSSLNSLTTNLNTRASSSDSDNNYDRESFDIDNLKRLSDGASDRYLFSAININDNSKTLTISMDEESGDIYDAFVSQTISSDNLEFVTSNIFSLEGELKL